MNNILVLGSGGREHALCWKILQSDHCAELYALPGNAGTAQIVQNIDIPLSDFRQIGEFCKKKTISMIIVGPEKPLVDGIVDFFESNYPDIHVFGPDKEASKLEGSKEYAKEFMKEHNIPTAAYKSFNSDQVSEALSYLDQNIGPYVLKADGLAAGKGVLIIEEKEEAKTALKEMLDGKFGVASSTVVIEEFLDGIEFSVFVITDGEDYLLLPSAKDYKRIGAGDTGLNTGGMGAISPVPFVTKELMARVELQVIKPTIHGIKNRKLNYKGFIFVGLIMVGNEPKVIEYNCRMGDPETEAVIPRIESDILDLISACFTGELKEKEIEINKQSATTVMLVSGGYPEAYEKGKKIDLPKELNGSIIFHSGTKLKNNELQTNGGRVLALTSFGPNFKDAVQLSMDLASKVNFEGKYYRTDIGFDL